MEQQKYVVRDFQNLIKSGRQQLIRKKMCLEHQNRMFGFSNILKFSLQSRPFHLMGIQCMRAEIDTHTPAFTYQNMINLNSMDAVGEDYEMMQLLGKGTFSDVYRARCKATGHYRAIKRMKIGHNQRAEHNLINEFEILREMDHPNILKMFQMYKDENYFYIVTELCKGCELFDELYKRKSFTEADASHIFLQIVSATRYLHQRGVMHRDLKPENIMYDPSTKMIKLVDFGSALRFSSMEVQQRKRAGTSYYIAPEVIERKYNHKCDVWSAGVILYIMLSGQPPYNGKNDTEILQKIRNTDFCFKNRIWIWISNDAKNLIERMLTKNLQERPQMSEVMKDPWIKTHLQTKTNPDNGFCLTECLKNMKKFKKVKSKGIQSGVLIFMVNFIKNSDDEDKMRRCFQELDSNGDGVVSVEQLAHGLSKFYNCKHKEAFAIAKSIFQRIDTNNSGKIEYSQFLVSASEMELIVTKENLQMAFDWMDEDQSGSLSILELRKKLGQHIEQDQYRQLIQQVKLTKNGEISKESFILMMTKLLKN